jgi:hypothetical protein
MEGGVTWVAIILGLMVVAAALVGLAVMLRRRRRLR